MREICTSGSMRGSSGTGDCRPLLSTLLWSVGSKQPHAVEGESFSHEVVHEELVRGGAGAACVETGKDAFPGEGSRLQVHVGTAERGVGGNVIAGGEDAEPVPWASALVEIPCL